MRATLGYHALMLVRSRRGPGARPIGAVLALLIAFAFLGPAVAQALPQPAAEALRRGQQAAAEALASYTHHRPDSPLWAEALTAGTEAARSAPDHPAPRRFLAQAYLQVGWYARSWSAWQAYLERGGTVDASVERQLVEVATWMGLNTYDAGRREQAVPYLETVVRYDPSDLGANARLAHLYLDRGEPLAALPYLEALNGRAPELIPALERARRIDRYGPAAADAYTAATEARDAGSIEIALTRFLEATELRPEFTDAWRGAAAAAERLGRLDVAEAAHRQVLVLAPNDAGALAGLARIAADEERARAEAEAEAAARAAAEQARARATAEAAAAQAAAQEAAEREATEQAAAQAAEAEAAEAEARAAAEADRAAAEQAAAEAQAREAARQDTARQAAADQTAADQTAAEREAADRVAAERAAEQAAAEQAAAERAAEERATAERAAAEVETRAPADASGGSLLLVDAVAEHSRSAAVASPSVAFLPAPGLADSDLAGHTGAVIHVRVEVLDKPSDAPVLYQLCLVPTDIAMRPACTDPSRLAFSTRGTYDADQAWSDLAGFGGVDWRAGIDSVMVVLRRPDGTPLESPRAGSEAGGEAGSEAGSEASGADLDAYLPMTVRIQALAVPAGAPFPGWP